LRHRRVRDREVGQLGFVVRRNKYAGEAERRVQDSVVVEMGKCLGDRAHDVERGRFRNRQVTHLISYAVRPMTNSRA
jgi:hypothetical protein